MPIKAIVADGLGFTPGSPRYVVTHGFGLVATVTRDIATAASIEAKFQTVDTRASIAILVVTRDIATAAALSVPVTRDIASAASLSVPGLLTIATAASITTPYHTQDIATAAAITIIWPDYGSMRVDVYDRTGVTKQGYGPIVDALAFDYSETLNEVGAGTVVFGATDPNASVIDDRVVLKVYLMGENSGAPVFVGKAVNTEWGDGRLTVRMLGIEEDLLAASCPPATVFTEASPALVMSTLLNAATTGLAGGWTAGLVGSTYRRFSKDVSFLSVFAALKAAADCFGFRVRVNQVAKTVDLTDSFGTSGITLVGAEFADRGDDTVAYITNAKKRKNSTVLFNRIIPYGAGPGWNVFDTIATTHGGDLLHNGDMSRLNPGGIIPLYWGAYQAQDGHMLVTRETFAFGGATYSCKFTNNDTSSPYGITYADTLSNGVSWPQGARGHSMRVEGWLYTSVAKVVRVRVGPYDGSTEYFETSFTTTAGQPTKVTFDFTPTTDTGWAQPTITIYRTASLSTGEATYATAFHLWDLSYGGYIRKEFTASDGRIVRYYEDTTAIATDGLRPRYVSWPDFFPTAASWENFVSNSNSLADRATRLLALYKAVATEFEPDVVGLSHALRAGQQVRSVYHQADDAIDVDASYWVMGRSYSRTKESEQWSLSLKSLDVPSQEDLNILEGIAQDLHSLDFSPVPSNVTPLFTMAPKTMAQQLSAANWTFAFYTDFRGLTSIAQAVLEVHQTAGPASRIQVFIQNPESTGSPGYWTVADVLTPTTSVNIDVTAYCQRFNTGVPWYSDGVNAAAHGPTFYLLSLQPGTPTIELKLKVSATKLPLKPGQVDPYNPSAPPVEPPPAPDAPAPIAFRQSTSFLRGDTVSASVELPMPMASVAHSLIVVYVGSVETAPIAVTDNAANSYSRGGKIDYNGRTMQVWYAWNANQSTGPLRVTVSGFAGLGSPVADLASYACAEEWTGIKSSATPFDAVSYTAVGDSTDRSITTFNANDLLLHFAYEYDPLHTGHVYTADPNWTVSGSLSLSGSLFKAIVEWRIPSAIGTYTRAASGSAAIATQESIVIAFKGAL